MGAEKRITLIGDSNIDPLRGFLKNAAGLAGYEVVAAPFGQLYQTLSTPAKDGWANVVWSAPERSLPHFYKAFNLEDVSHADVLSDVDDFANAIIRACEYAYQFVASWVMPPNFGGYGMLEWKDSIGLTNLLAKCNLRLAEKLAACENVFILDTQRWLSTIAVPLSPQMWYAAKVAYVPKVFERAAKDIEAVVIGIDGKSRRLIVLDLDNTLWGGVVGETGWEGIRLGGHDHLGEAFKDFQRELKALSNRGIQLALCSKNDENVALEAIDNHPEMILKRTDFAGWRINWNDKAGNVMAIVEELNLGMESVVFIDDNPAERTRVADAVKGILVPDWPKDPTAYVSALRALNCFQAPAISTEDRGRKAMYVAERSRRDVKTDVGTEDEWLEKLGTCVRVSPITPANLSRVTQLFNKTNQLNLTTRRLSQKEITDWAAAPSRAMLAVSVSDKFGDMGLVGIISVEAHGKEGVLSDFILSCRVMGRCVEETLIHLAVSELKRLGAEVMTVHYLPTERNRPTLEVMEKAGLKQVKKHVFEVRIAEGYDKPASMTLEMFSHGLEIRRCAPNEIGEVMAFINTHWKEGHVLATNQKLMDWQHKAPDGSYNYLLAWEGNKILGVLGYIPTARYDEGLRSKNMLWLALWKIREDCKVPMLGLRLLGAMDTAEPNCGLAVSGINLAHPPMYKALGYNVADMVQYVLVRPKAKRMILQAPTGFSPPAPASAGAGLTEMDKTALDALEMGVTSACPQKSSRHFIARFLEHPFYRYRVFAISQGGVPKALVAIRKAEHGGSAILRLVDFFGDANVLGHCGEAFAVLLDNENCEYMDFWQHGIAPEVLEAAGFFPIALEGDVIAPNFFEPFLAKNGRIVCAVKAQDDVPIIVCRADGDQDRPNLLGTA